MNIRTPSDHYLDKFTLAPQAIGAGATVNGTGVDTFGYETASVKVIMGAIADAANTSVTVKLQDSPDNSNWTDLTSMTTGAVLNAGQNEVYLFDVNLSECNRYIRAVVTGGSAAGGLVAALVELLEGRDIPPTQENTVLQYGYTKN